MAFRQKTVDTDVHFTANLVDLHSIFNNKIQIEIVWIFPIVSNVIILLTAEMSHFNAEPPTEIYFLSS